MVKKIQTKVPLQEVNTIGRYFKKKFKEKVYKVPISISGFTCPNIDGTVAHGGCSFCENDSFSPNLQDKKSKFKLSPKTVENPYLENQLKQLELQFNATKNRLEKNLVLKSLLFISNHLPILMLPLKHSKPYTIKL